MHGAENVKFRNKLFTNKNMTLNSHFSSSNMKAKKKITGPHVLRLIGILIPEMKPRFMFLTP